ncbi:MAG: magnesium chelatase subunit H [Actinomycetota bacterium]
MKLPELVPTRITAILTSTSMSKWISEALQQIREEYGDIIKVRLYNWHEIEEELVEDSTLGKNLQNADIVLIDIRGGGRPSKIVSETLSSTKNTVIVLCGGSEYVLSLTRMGSFSMDKIMQRRKTTGIDYKKIQKISNMIDKMGKILPLGFLKHARNWIIAMKYWSNGGTENIKNLLLFIVKNYGKNRVKVKLNPPIEYPEEGIYDPFEQKFYGTLDAYLRDHKLEKPYTVGMLSFGGMHLEECYVGIKALMEKLKPYANIIPTFSSSMEGCKDIKEFFYKNGKPIVDAVVSFRWFRLNGGPLGGDPQVTLDTLQNLDVPVFDGTPMLMREIQKWKASEIGLSPLEVVTAVTLPELDGIIEPIPSSGLAEVGYDRNIEGRVKTILPIDDRIERMAQRVLNWVKLHGKRNSNKRIAFIIFNYPPGEDNLGSAAYLDVFESMKRILQRLKKEGYSVGDLPEKSLHELFLEQSVVNSGKWIAQKKLIANLINIDRPTYSKWFDELPESIKESVIRDWGSPPGNVMVHNGRLLIPGIEFGNIFVGIQPSRGVHENPEKAYHDKALAPHHQYIAFYKWLENEFKADAVVHVGTHGTLEFTAGKEIGLSRECFPDNLIGNLPHIYIYWVTNSSEATIAKRRSYATIVNHMTPTFTSSSLYDELSKLDDLIAEYNEARVQDPLRAQRVEEQILKVTKELNFRSESIEEIHSEIFEIKRSIIPKGLHIMGEKYDDDGLVEFLTFILRYDRGEIKSLHRILLESQGINYDWAMKNPGESLGGKTYAQILEDIESKARDLARKVLFESLNDALKSVEVSKDLTFELEKTLKFGLKVIEDYRRGDELGGLIHALEGRYTYPNIGGDPIRTPDVLPTGSNTFQFDPRMVPSDAAYERGSEIAENTLKRYRHIHGYPESVGVVLWGFETMKTRGETIGQILRYIGVRPIGSVWDKRLKVIPLEELGRPRIDVLVTICGIFRDTFPNVIKLLDEAFNLVASLDESENMNYVKKHSTEILEEIEPGVEHREKMANARIYGPSAAQYATRVTNLIETSNWKEEKTIGKVYISSMKHAYGYNLHAVEAEKVLKAMLSKVELVSQVRDTHEYEIIELDHYYEFFGGLSKAVETTSGKKPEMLISDTTKEIIKTENVEDAIERGVRARLLNPKWIDGMLKHDFHGAQKIADRVEYVLGLAATTNRVDNWIWSGIAERYIFDEEMRKRMAENNRFATAEIVNRLLEANKRGYWDATDEQIEKLKGAYLEIEGWIEEKL